MIPCPSRKILFLACAALFVAGSTSTFAASPPPETHVLDKWLTTVPVPVPLPGRQIRMMAYDVTFDLWNLCLAQDSCDGYHPDDQNWGQGDHPVINVSADEAMHFALWLSHYTGRHFRLPTDDEWEYAARGGTSTAYWWGNDPDCSKANFGLLANACGKREFKTLPVGSMPPNPYGLYDITGNVWQWTSTCADTDCTQRGLRGGSFIDAPIYLRPSFKGANQANMHYMLYGFRLVEEP